MGDKIASGSHSLKEILSQRWFKLNIEPEKGEMEWKIKKLSSQEEQALSAAI